MYDDDKNKVEEKIPNEQMIFYTQQLIQGLEQVSYFHKQQIMSLYKIQEQVVKRKMLQAAHLKRIFSKT